MRDGNVSQNFWHEVFRFAEADRLAGALLVCTADVDEILSLGALTFSRIWSAKEGTQLVDTVVSPHVGLQPGSDGHVGSPVGACRIRTTPRDAGDCGAI